jgi:hypothetical protein
MLLASTGGDVQLAYLISETDPRCQDSCRLIGFIKTIHRGRKETCNAALFT